ncbi:MAG: four helix bundle protein [candidate division WOR-3 bacterium]|nr:four helix bundle protein [candidate division WOR-3 bacterium]
MKEKKRITSFHDLDVYQNTYKACIEIMKRIVPRLPESEKYDLKDQLSRSCKAIPRLIAEGYAKRHQKMGFQKYLDDGMAECNETIVSLSQARDIYDNSADVDLCNSLIDTYDKSGRQLYNLAIAWSKFKRGSKDVR